MKPAKRKRRTREVDFDLDEQPEVKPSRRRKGRRRLFVLFLLLVAAVALLPTIVSKTPLRGMLIARAIKGSELQVAIGNASVGWLTPISIESIQVSDAWNGELLAAESIRLDRSLLSLLMNSSDLGALEIVRPKLRIAIRPEGSNLEGAISRLTQLFNVGDSTAPADAASNVNASPAVAIRVTEGTILVVDEKPAREWRLDGVSLQAELGPDGLRQLAIDGQLADSGARGSIGNIKAGMAPVEGAAADKRQITWRLENVPLAVIGPWLRRAATGAELAGTLSGQGEAVWTTSGTTNGPLPAGFATSGALSIDRLDAAAPALAGDRVQLARVEIPWRLTSQSDGLSPQSLIIEQLQLRSEIGQVALRGVLDTQMLSSANAATANVAPTNVGTQELELRGAFDLARLAAMFPRMLRIRTDTSITSGTLEIVAKRQPALGGDVLTASLRTTQLAATSSGRPLRWDEPISANATVRRTPDGLRLDSLTCNSEFLAANATGTADQFTASARFDLNRLAQQLGQFIDLNGIELAGTGEAVANWQLVGNSQFKATANARLAQLRIGTAGGDAWVEPLLELTASANGLIDNTTRSMTQVDEATFQVSAEGDQFAANLDGAVRLTAPNSGTAVAANQAPTQWPILVRATGSIARWLTRSKPFVDTAGWQADGQTELIANVRIAGNLLSASEAKLSIGNFRAANADWAIQEPRVEFTTGDARYDLATGAMSAGVFQFVSSALSLAAQDIGLTAAKSGGLVPRGAVAFRGDLARIAAWRANAGRNPANAIQPVYHPTGRFSGNMLIAHHENTIRAKVNAVGEELTLTQLSLGPDGRAAKSPPIWQEAKVALQGGADHDLSMDRLTITSFQVESNTLNAALEGKIEKLSTAAETKLNGTVNYDLAQLTPLLRPYLGEGVQLNGREQAKFAVVGALKSPQDRLAFVSQSSASPSAHWSRRMQARLEVPWSGANVYGLPIGAGRLSAALGDGGVRIDPLSLSVAEGQLTAAPNIQFDPAPSELTLPAGPLLSNVRISPEVSEAMLKYIAPVLSGATESDGKFSLTLAGARLPLENAKQADMGGQLTVHSVRVVPGEMARQWIGMARQIETLAKGGGNPLSALGQQQQPAATSQREITLLSIRDQQVNFRVVEGRVHHESMEFQVEDVVLRSSGSVGFDETISLVLTVPIQDRWIEKQQLLAGLRGQSLQIPITGTLKRPQMDQRALANLSGQVLQGAAGQAVGNELNRALDKLFKPR